MLRKLFSALFSKPERYGQDPDRCYWKSQNAKLAGIFAEASKHSNVTVLAWFEDLYEALKQVPNSASVRVDLADRYLLNPGSMTGEVVFIAETYPLFDKEMQLINVLYRAGVAKIYVYASLDEDVYRSFGSERILDILDTLGMKDEESIQHSMIDKSVERARKRIASQMRGPERSTRTSQEWFRENQSA